MAFKAAHIHVFVLALALCSLSISGGEVFNLDDHHASYDATGMARGMGHAHATLALKKHSLVDTVLPTVGHKNILIMNSPLRLLVVPFLPIIHISAN